MADLFLHLAFARRLRLAQGLHPLAGETMGRRRALVSFGAGLAGLPSRERQGLSWFSRIFSGGGEAARWQKLLAATPGQPRVDLVVSVLRDSDVVLGPMARFALGIGVLAHEILEEKIGPLTASLAGPQRASVERAQARLWLQALDIKAPDQLGNEWRPALELADSEAQKRPMQHMDRAIKRVHGSGPGEAALSRWLKALASELGPVAGASDRDGWLPSTLSLSDSDARVAHFEKVAFQDATASATALFVTYVNRLAEAFEKGSPDEAALSDALGKLEDSKPDVEASRLRWNVWLDATRLAALTRGRNPKPAFAEGEPVSASHVLASSTKVMSLADLPPETDDSGAPPVPEVAASTDEGFAVNVTQEVSASQIEAESRAFLAAALAGPAAASERAAFQVPNVTQPVAPADIEVIDPPPPPVTEAPIVIADATVSAAVALAAAPEGDTAAPALSGEANGAGHVSVDPSAEAQPPVRMESEPPRE